MSEQACNTYSLTIVPLYDTLGTEAISFILTHTELKLVVCDSMDKVLQLLKTKSSLEYIVALDEISEEARRLADERGIKLLTFDQVKATGAQKRRKPAPPRPDDVSTVCYTSGTTGTPKGSSRYLDTKANQNRKNKKFNNSTFYVMCNV